MFTDRIELSAVLYEAESGWVVQALEYDITAHGNSLLDAHKNFERRLLAEIAICIELGETSLSAIGPAPQKYWRMFEHARLEVGGEMSPVRLIDGPAIFPHIVPRVKVAEHLAA